MFLHSCFIRKNTPELRQYLDNIGYNYGGKVSKFEQPYLYCSLDKYFECNSFPARYHRIIDCEENEELFLAVAALSDDTDYMQWFKIPNTKYVPIPGYCGQQGTNGYQQIITSIEYHKHDKKDNSITEKIKFAEEEGETILPRKLTVDELKLWFNHKIMPNPYS
jgi:hypothetical protein